MSQVARPKLCAFIRDMNSSGTYAARENVSVVLKTPNTRVRLEQARPPYSRRNPLKKLLSRPRIRGARATFQSSSWSRPEGLVPLDSGGRLVESTCPPRCSARGQQQRALLRRVLPNLMSRREDQLTTHALMNMCPPRRKETLSSESVQ